MQSHTQLTCTEERHGSIPLGRWYRGDPVAGLQRWCRRLHQQTYKDEHPAQSRAGYSKAHPIYRGTGER